MPPPLRFLRTASHLQVRMDILAFATHQEATAKPVMSPSDYSSPVAVSNFIFFRSSRSTWLHSRLLLKNCFFFPKKDVTSVIRISSTQNNGGSDLILCWVRAACLCPRTCLDLDQATPMLENVPFHVQTKHLHFNLTFVWGVLGAGSVIMSIQLSMFVCN